MFPSSETPLAGPSILTPERGREESWRADRWGFPADPIGIAKWASVSGPCFKPLHRAWVRGGNGTPVQGPGGQEFYQTGPLVWMVNHGLAPGQEGNDAQRRLYVHLLTFPPGQLPRLATGVPAAAVVQAIVYYGDASLPADPKDAFVALAKRSPDAAAGMDRATLLTLGQQAFAALAAGTTAQQLVDALAKDPFSEFDVYVATVPDLRHQRTRQSHRRPRVYRMFWSNPMRPCSSRHPSTAANTSLLTSSSWSAGIDCQN